MVSCPFASMRDNVSRQFQLPRTSTQSMIRGCAEYPAERRAGTPIARWLERALAMEDDLDRVAHVIVPGLLFLLALSLPCQPARGADLAADAPAPAARCRPGLDSKPASLGSAMVDTPGELRAAIRLLNQVALQGEMAGDGQQMQLLEMARTSLREALPILCCAQREAAVALESNLARILARAIAQRSPIERATGASLGPSAPTRSELRILARQGQNLIYNDCIDFPPYAVWSRAFGGSERPPHNAADVQYTDLAPIGLPPWPADGPSTQMQFGFRF